MQKARCAPSGSVPRPTNEEERWDYVLRLDDELLRGSVMLSEWATFLARDAETAYAKGAYLATILVAMAVVETHLRWMCGSAGPKRLADLIDQAAVEDDLRRELHALRKYRNTWVHVEAPSNDWHLLERPDEHALELQDSAQAAIRAMLRTLYSEQGT